MILGRENMADEEKTRVWWDEELGIARAKAFGVIDEEIAGRIKAATDRLVKEHPGKIDWLVDLSEMTKATSKARKILVEITADPGIRKYALAGASVFIRTVANFISAAAGQKNARHFATMDEALEWLKEER